MNSEQELFETIKYLNKIRDLIERDAIFSFKATRIVSRSKVDDLLCCVQASLPQEYTNYVKKHKGKTLHSVVCYDGLLKAVKNKFLFSRNVYSVNYADAQSALAELQKAIKSDMVYIRNL